MQTIYIVEDDTNIRELVAYALQNAGYEVKQFPSGQGLLETCHQEVPDMVILDIMLPLEDGLSLLRKLRAHSSTTHIPVILLTVKDTEMDKIRGLDLGADDYITKPFSILELISRVQAVLRRTTRKASSTILEVGTMVLDRTKRSVRANGESVDLTYTEFEILALLMSYPEVVFTRSQIMDGLWGYEFTGESRTIDMHIKELRRKLKDCGSYIHTVRNVGYVIKSEGP